ncbi:inositol monophosphatase [Candidatus Daviesbacteria bacterium]|nr:inositol monophosphatase [Candidatus Daviesbacteria bacterium]
MNDKQSLRSNDLKFLKVAKQAALEAGKIISKYLGEDLDKKNKNGDHSNFVTAADLESEKAILKILHKNYPKFNYIAEEKGISDLGSDYTWVIDPLDGTIAFSVGLPTYTVSIGLLHKNNPILGVIYHVVPKDLYHAAIGKGAYLNGKKIKVSQTKKLDGAILGIDFAHREKRMSKTQKYILPLIDKIRYPFALGGDVLMMALIGRGSFDGFANEANIWNCIAGAIIVTEAGGKVTDSKGAKINWSKKRLEIVASNGVLHNQILDVLKT